MYFSNFQKIYYDFPVKANQDNSLFVLTDITSNVRVRKEILENITLYDEYDILDGETPELIAEKIYGNAEYHWVIMLVNQRYDYLKDFPMSVGELYEYVNDKYGAAQRDAVHHYEKKGIIVEALATMKVPSIAHSQLKKNDFILSSTANARIEAISYEFIASNILYQSNFAVSKSVKVYGDPLATRGIEDYLGTATLYSLDGTSIILGNLNLLSGKSAVDIKSIYTEANEFQCNVLLNSNSQPVIAVLVDYGRFVPGQIATARGFRLSSDGTQTFANIVSYYVPQSGGFVLNEEYLPITNYEHELAINESKRRIKIISPQLVAQIVEELRQLMTA